MQGSRGTRLGFWLVRPMGFFRWRLTIRPTRPRRVAAKIQRPARRVNSSVSCQKPEIAMCRIHLALLAFWVLCFSACSANNLEPPTVASAPPPQSGERLAYLVGCVNCHHQTPKEIINAPPLLIVKTYSLPEFRILMNTGVTRDGRDMYAQGSIMGIVAREQFSHFTDQEVAAVHMFLQTEWTTERAAREEEKIAEFPPPTWMNN